MRDEFLPNADDDLKTWTTAFVNGVTVNAASLGITDGETDLLQDQQGDFANALANVAAKRAAYKAAVTMKNERRAALETGVRVVVRRIQASPTVPDTLRKTLGISVRDRVPSLHAPLAPTQLSVRGTDFGTNVLKWNRAENRAGTLFVVEAKAGASASFILVDVVKTTRYAHANQMPGVRIVYRVRARRGSTVSAPSNEGIVYAG